MCPWPGHGLLGPSSGTWEASYAQGVCHILGHLERGLKDKGPFGPPSPPSESGKEHAAFFLGLPLYEMLGQKPFFLAWLHHPSTWAYASQLLEYMPQRHLVRALEDQFPPPLECGSSLRGFF